jgi:hypothetical protein
MNRVDRKVETQDLYCGAYILASGGELEGLRIGGVRNGRPAVTFVFIGDEVEELLKSYRSGKALVNLADYKAAMNHLKDVMFERLRVREEKESREYGNRKAL